MVEEQGTWEPIWPVGYRDYASQVFMVPKKTTDIHLVSYRYASIEPNYRKHGTSTAVAKTATTQD